MTQWPPWSVEIWISAIRLRDLEEDLAASGWRLVRVARKLGRVTEHVFALVEARG